MVTLNDRLDYFGSTVNVAARVSDLVRGTETAFTRPVQADPGVQAVVDASGYDIVEFRSDVKGLDETLTLFCLLKSGMALGGRSGWRAAVRRRLGIWSG